jgi:hypothetical protein
MSFEILDASFDLARLPKNHYVGDVFLKYRWQIMNRAQRAGDELAQSALRLTPSHVRE